MHLETTVIALAATVIVGSSLTCERELECTSLLKGVESAILQDETNLSRMRRAFSHSPTATPVLLKVVYNLTYAENITKAVATNDIPQCSSFRLVDNSTIIDLKQRNITYGWTSSGVYTVFHPTILSMMQAHTPFAILRIHHASEGSWNRHLSLGRLLRPTNSSTQYAHCFHNMHSFQWHAWGCIDGL